MKSRSPRGELVVVGSLLAAGACAVAFVLLYIFDSHNTQLLGLSLGLALVFLAVASVVAGRKVVDQRKGVEEPARADASNGARSAMQPRRRLDEPVFR